MAPLSDGALKRLIPRHNLARIEITITERSILARAFPATYHPLVATRRDEEIRAAGGSINMAQADKITAEIMGHVASFSASTLDGALAGLVNLLKGLDHGS